MNQIPTGLGLPVSDHRPADHARGRTSRARPEPRLAGRTVIVPRDIGVRVPPTTRSLLDRLRAEFHLQEAELARVLLASALLAGQPLRDRVAAALFSNAVLRVLAGAASIVAALRTELAELSSSIADATTPVEVLAHETERGPRDESLLRVKTGEHLHRRIRDLVEVYMAVRQDGEIPQTFDVPSQRLTQHLLSRGPAEIERERSPVAEVVRWALAEAEADADEMVAAYVDCRRVLWARVDRAVQAMRSGATEELRAALGEVR